MKAIADRRFQSFGQSVGGGTAPRFDFYTKFGHRTAFVNREPKLHDFFKPAYDALDNAWEHVDPSNHHHVIQTTEHATLHSDKRSPTGTPPVLDGHLIAGPISDKRTSHSSEVGQDEFTGFACGNGARGIRIDDFGNEFGFDHVEATRCLNALEPPRPDFGHPRMVKDPRPERGFNTPARSRDVPTRFARNNQRPNRGTRQIDSVLGRNLREPKGIRRRTTDERRLVIQRVLVSGTGRHPTAGKAKRTQTSRTFEGAPESDKGPERKWKQDAIFR